MNEYANDAQVWKKSSHRSDELRPGGTYFANAYVKLGQSRLGYFYETREGAERGARWSGILNCRLRIQMKP